MVPGVVLEKYFLFRWLRRSSIDSVLERSLASNFCAWGDPGIANDPTTARVKSKYWIAMYARKQVVVETRSLSFLEVLLICEHFSLIWKAHHQARPNEWLINIKMNLNSNIRTWLEGNFPKRISESWRYGEHNNPTFYEERITEPNPVMPSNAYCTELKGLYPWLFKMHYGLCVIWTQG